MLLNNVEKSMEKLERRERNILILHRDGLTHTYVEIPVIIGQNFLFFLKKVTFSTKRHVDLICRSSVCVKTCEGQFHNVIYRIVRFKRGGVSAWPTMAQICHRVIERREEGRSLVIPAAGGKKRAE